MRNTGGFSLGKRLQGLFGRKLDEQVLEQVEEILIEADFGLEFTDRIMDQVRARARGPGDRLMEELRAAVREQMIRPSSGGREPREDRTPENRGDLTAECWGELEHRGPPPGGPARRGPDVYLVFGVNGTGKTTTVGKLARLLRVRGRRVLIAAADTYRDAAVEQLSVWARRAEVPVVRQDQGADPAAVVFDACDAALARGVDALVVDTAGRLHNKERPMAELSKLGRVLDRKLPDSRKLKLLTIDATTGQNGIVQAEQFDRHIGVHGIILTKLDSSSKGGVACAIWGKLGIPILYVGTGERLEDLEPFSVDDYLDALFSVQ
ncbi:MAG: signal recognition particle-docking protein FtsY [Spirochaetota bacterium]